MSGLIVYQHVRFMQGWELNPARPHTSKQSINWTSGLSLDFIVVAARKARDRKEVRGVHSL